MVLRKDMRYNISFVLLVIVFFFLVYASIVRAQSTPTGATTLNLYTFIRGGKTGNFTLNYIDPDGTRVDKMLSMGSFAVGLQLKPYTQVNLSWVDPPAFERFEADGSTQWVSSASGYVDNRYLTFYHQWSNRFVVAVARGGSDLWADNHVNLKSTQLGTLGGFAATFRGNSAAIDVSNFALPAQGSVCAWVKPTGFADPGGYNGIVSWDGGPENRMAVTWEGWNGMSLFINGRQTAVRGTISLDSWHLVCASWNSSSQSISIDLATSTSEVGGAITPMNNLNLVIGAWGADSWNGSIANVQIYSNVMNQSEISEMYLQGIDSSPVPNMSLQAWWKLDQMNGDTVADSVSGKLGILQGAVSWVAGQRAYSVTSRAMVWTDDMGLATFDSSSTKSSEIEHWVTRDTASFSITSGNNSFNAVYYNQLNVNWRVVTPGQTPLNSTDFVKVSFYQFGKLLTSDGFSSSFTAWADRGSTYSFLSLSQQSNSKERWLLKSPNGTISLGGGVDVLYQHQYRIRFNAYARSRIQFVSFSSDFSQILDGAQDIWADANSAIKARLVYTGPEMIWNASFAGYLYLGTANTNFQILSTDPVEDFAWSFTTKELKFRTNSTIWLFAPEYGKPYRITSNGMEQTFEWVDISNLVEFSTRGLATMQWNDPSSPKVIVPLLHVYALPGSTVNQTLDLQWVGNQSITLLFISFRNAYGLNLNLSVTTPFQISGGNGELSRYHASLPISVSVPSSLSPGTYNITVFVEVMSGNSRIHTLGTIVVHVVSQRTVDSTTSALMIAALGVGATGLITVKLRQHQKYELQYKERAKCKPETKAQCRHGFAFAT